MDFVADRSEAETRLFSSLSAPQNVRALRNFAITLSAVLTVLFAICLAIVLRAVRRAKAKARRTLCDIFGQVLLSLVTCAWASALLSLDGNWQGCAIVGSFGAALYVLQHFFCSRVLAVRAMAVRDIMPDWYVTLFNIVWYAVYSCFGAFVLAVIAFSGKLMYEEEFCIVRLHYLLPIFMAVADGILSLSLLFLFVWPVLRQSSEVSHGQSGNASDQARTLRKLARENLVLSAIPIVSTMMLMVLLATTTQAKSYSEGNTEFIPYMDLLGGLGDEFINTIGSFVMFRKLLFSSQNPRKKMVRPIKGPMKR